MNKSATHIIDRVESILKSKGYNKEVSSNDNVVLFALEDESYSVVFDNDKKTVELRNFNGQTPEKFKVISKWLFDPDESTRQDIEDIANDFENSLGGDEKPQSYKNQKKKKDTDGNVNSMFLINRFATVFPEIKDKISEEKESHKDFRYVTFTRENIVPLIKQELDQGSKSARVKKISGLLNDLYKSGDLDVRSIVTIVILNSIESQDHLDIISKGMSDELKKSFIEARKFRGKKVKPEKKGISTKILSKSQKS